MHYKEDTGFGKGVATNTACTHYGRPDRMTT